MGYNKSMGEESAPYIFYQGGTLVLKEIAEAPPPPFRLVKSQWHCEGYRYPEVSSWFRQQQIRDTLPRWATLHLQLFDQRQPHDYQIQALASWEANHRRGSIVLPTGAGKTFVAIQAIFDAACSTLVVAPTIDLLHQWYARLVNAFQTPIGVYYGAEKNIQPITITTYHSAGDLVADQGNAFKLIIFDEVHHLPAPSWAETALMAPAPFRLGLTATYPGEEEQSGERHRLDELIGPVVFTQKIGDLVGQQLAEYRTERIRIDLTEEERQRYEADYAIYSTFFRERRLQATHGAGWLLELTRLSAFDQEARRAFLARQRISRLLASAEGKLTALEGLLQEYRQEQTLVFTENNQVAYEIARRHLVPVISAETAAAERKLILDRFSRGEYPVVVTCQVLNEGVDVPEAKIAIVLGGTGGAREYIQRLGRVLRKVENRKAVLYEVVARRTTEERKSRIKSKNADR